MDTVKLEGKGFHPVAKEGDRVKKGDLLLEFDLDYIKSQALSIITPVIISNSCDLEKVVVQAEGNVKVSDKIIQFQK